MILECGPQTDSGFVLCMNFKWEMIQSVSNEFNKIVVYDSKLYHSSLDYFGDTLQNGRLFQVFFFDTERSNR